MCNCSGRKGNTSCSSKTAADYQNYKDKYQCVITNNGYVAVGIEETEVNEQIALLDLAITQKNLNPGSCSYSTYETKWRTDTNKIIMILSC